MTIEEELKRLAVEPPLRACTCDFCTGKKRWEDNWCSRCAKVQMKAPKWWENCDVCDDCEKREEQERASGR